MLTIYRKMFRRMTVLSFIIVGFLAANTNLALSAHAIATGNNYSTNANASKLPSRGTYRFTGRHGVKNSASLSSSDIAYYDAGNSVNYDKTLVAEGYEWISYISYSGARRYIAIRPLASQSQQVPTPAATPPVKVTISPSGRYTFSQRTAVRSSASMSAPSIAHYDAGESVNYDKVVTAEGRQWISYVSYSGVRRYIAIDQTASNNGNVAKPKPIVGANTTGRWGSNPNTYAFGNCTWYVKSVFGSKVGDYWGNGGDWAASAAAAGIPTGTRPQVGAIVSIAAGYHGSTVPYGHVAIVAEVRGNKIRLSEMNVRGFNVVSHDRWVTLDGCRFIYIS